MLVKVRRRGGRIVSAAGDGSLRRSGQQAASRPRHHADVLSRGVLPLPGAPLTCRRNDPCAPCNRGTEAMDPARAQQRANFHAPPAPACGRCHAPSRMRSGMSEPGSPGDMTHSARGALADNLRALFPGEDERALERRALDTSGPTRATSSISSAPLSLPPQQARELFDGEPRPIARLFTDLLAEGRGIILVTGHYGNWEIGSILMP